MPGETAVCSGFGPWFARAACPSAAIYAEEFCQPVKRTRLDFGSEVLPRVSKPSGTSSSRQESSVLDSAKGEGLPLRRPTHGSTRQDAECRARRPSRLVQRETDAGSCSARRTASRRLQVTPSEPLFSRGKRRAACPLARGCVLRVNRFNVGRTLA